MQQTTFRNPILARNLRRLLGGTIFASLGFVSCYLFHRPQHPATHDSIRTIAVTSQADQATEIEILIAGDSIVEFAYLPELCGEKVFNVGMGGAGVIQTQTLLGKVLPRIKVKQIIIAVGINDSAGGQWPNVAGFGQAYRALIQSAVASGAAVTIATIAPIAENIPLDSRYFNIDEIRRTNDEIRRIAHETGRTLIDFDAAMAGPNGFLPPGFTTDGVHLTMAGYRIWGDTIGKAVCPSASPGPTRR
jgi:lysophospholipase L1-like esterase